MSPSRAAVYGWSPWTPTMIDKECLLSILSMGIALQSISISNKQEGVILKINKAYVRWSSINSRKRSYIPLRRITAFKYGLPTYMTRAVPEEDVSRAFYIVASNISAQFLAPNRQVMVLLVKCLSSLSASSYS